MHDPSQHSNAPGERGPFIPQNDFERDHAEVIRAKMVAGGLTRSQAILAVRSQIEHDASAGTPPAGHTHAANLGRPFAAEDDFAVKHADAIRERMRGGISQAQAVACVKQQLAEDARRAGKNP